jgi:hypothetical protein
VDTAECKLPSGEAVTQNDSGHRVPVDAGTLVHYEKTVRVMLNLTQRQLQVELEQWLLLQRDDQPAHE